ncbi:MAG: AbrB/MazE/SpoVT family DNA-binding domain-containing protein [Acidimicrobiales bacterium]
MRTTIDRAGRIVIPKSLRDALGIHEGEVELSHDGTGIRIEPVTDHTLSEEGERLVIPASGDHVVTDDDVIALRDAGRR